MSEVIYFISDGGASIKIGRSARVGQRMREMQTGNSERLVFLGCTPGSQAHERKIHQKLAAFRLQGEWFADCEEVRSAIKEALANGVHVDPPLSPKKAVLSSGSEYQPGRLSRAFARLEAACPFHPALTMPMADLLALSDEENAAMNAAVIKQMVETLPVSEGE